jgi:uncharacterized damage-inducible protein DinB
VEQWPIPSLAGFAKDVAGRLRLILPQIKTILTTILRRANILGAILEEELMRGKMVTAVRAWVLSALLVLCVRAHAQALPAGIWEGYDGEWDHTSSQLMALAEATPEADFAWRPAKGVRSTSEVYMHIVMANLYLLSVTGPKMPADLKEDAEKTVTSKQDVMRWLKRSLDAVKEAHLRETPEHLAKKVHIEDRDATVDGIYLRIIIHANEHMGQLVAYARMTGVVPPWSK